MLASKCLSLPFQGEKKVTIQKKYLKTFLKFLTKKKKKICLV